MSNLNIDELVNTMITSAKSVLNNPNLSGELNDAISKFKELGNCIAKIEKSKLECQITEQDAYDLIDMQKNAIKSELLEIQGIEAVTAEKAINAAINAVSGTINTALGWALL